MRVLTLIAVLMLALPVFGQDPGLQPPSPIPEPIKLKDPPPLVNPQPILTKPSGGFGINPATGKPYTPDELKALSANMRKYAESPVAKGSTYIISRSEHLYTRLSIGGELGDNLMIEQSPAVILYGQGYLNNTAHSEALTQIADFNARHLALFSQASAGANMFDFSKPVDDKIIEQAQKNLVLYTAYEKRMETILADCAPLFKQKLPIIAQLVAVDKDIKRSRYLQEPDGPLYDRRKQLEAQLEPIDAQITAKVAPIRDMCQRDLFGPNATKGPDLPPEELKKDSKLSGMKFLTKGPSGWRPGGNNLVMGAPTIAEVTFDNDPGDTVPPLVLTVGGKRLELPLKLVPGAPGAPKVFRSGEFLPWPGESSDGGLPLPAPIR